MLDEQGQLFVRTFTRGKAKGEYEVDVFDAEGRFIAQFITKSDLKLFKKNKAYGIEKTADGFWVIKRYALSWEKWSSFFPKASTVFIQSNFLTAKTFWYPRCSLCLIFS